MAKGATKNVFNTKPENDKYSNLEILMKKHVGLQKKVV